MSILVVDDEEGIRTFLAAVLEGEGYEVVQAADGDEAARLLDARAFHLLLTDLKMPGMDGMSLVRKARAEQPEMEVIVLTAFATVETAVQAMKLGAVDYLTKPLRNPDELRLVVRRALSRRRMAQAGEHVARLPGPRYLPARDPAMLAVERQIERVAPTDATVLLLGESGTGKEVAARRIHALSRRAEGPFVAVNCAALTPELLASELFGHEKGAFTGAVSRRQGRFELADAGTLFLDEIGELAPDLQVKLLRVLQERAFERVGGTRTIRVDVRLVAATNRDLVAAMTAGRFRDDLYHRLAVFPITLPALRHRPADIVPLAEHLLEEVALDLGRPGLRLTAAARAGLPTHPWPGNVRELREALERAAILADGLEVDAVVPPPGPGGAALAEAMPAGASLRDLERQAIRAALAEAGGHRRHAAERLGIAERTLYAKLKEYGL